MFGAAHMYVGGKLGYDPEGLLGTIPAMATVLIGYWAGRTLRSRRHLDRASDSLATAGGLALAALVLIGLGLWGGQGFPVNKRLWTSSFVLLMAGWSTLALAAAHLVVDGPGRDWARAWPRRCPLSAPMPSSSRSGPS